jgi:hypothetical protein
MPDRCTRDQPGVSRTENLSVGNDNSDRTSLSASQCSRAAVEVSRECSGSVSGVLAGCCASRPQEGGVDHWG